LITKLRPRRRTTIEPSFDLSALSEFLAFMVPPAAELVTSRVAENGHTMLGTVLT
jgi:hypothetical protein